VAFDDTNAHVSPVLVALFGDDISKMERFVYVKKRSEDFIVDPILLFVVATEVDDVKVLHGQSSFAFYI